MPNKYLSFLIGPIVVLAFVLRLHGFTSPIADWHSWRQADTSAVSRHFVNYGIDLLHPHYEDLSNIPSGKDNPEGYRFVEFPIYNLFQAGGFLLFHTFTLEEWGRIVTIISSLLSTLFIFILTKKYAGTVAGLFAGSFYAFLPYSIYYGRTILPDTSMIMAVLGGIYFFDKWLEESENAKIKNHKWQVISKNYFFFVFAILFTSIALLLKPYALFFVLPMVYVAYSHFGWKLIGKWQLWLFLLLSLLPLVLWRLWMTQYPEGIPVNAWLFNGGNIRFKGAYFYWIFADRIGRLILGYWGVALFAVGLIVQIKGWAQSHLRFGNWLFFFSFLLSSLLYVVVIARGNVQHDYYQILIIPSLVMFMGIGARFLCFPPREIIHPLASRILLGVAIIFTFLFGWYFVRDYFNINNPNLMFAGQAVDRLTPKDAKIIAPYDGDTSFLYQTKRQGWPSFEKDLPQMIQMGADYLVLVNPQQRDLAFAKDYKIVASNSAYLLFNLRERP